MYLKNSEIMYSRVDVFFRIYFEILQKSSLRDIGRLKIRKDVGSGNSEKFLQNNPNSDIFYS